MSTIIFCNEIIPHSFLAKLRVTKVMSGKIDIVQNCPERYKNLNLLLLGL